MSDVTTPGLPETYNIPPQAVSEWLALPDGHQFYLHLTKSSVDHLYFSIDKIINSQAQFQQCLISYTNNNTDAANDALVVSQRMLVEAQNRLRYFMTELIISATR